MDHYQSRGERLRFRRATIEGKEIPKGKVDEIRQTLGDEYCDPRFEALAKALEILGAINAEEELEKLREEWHTVDDVVDQVVEKHHVAFNSSLQSYSQVIKLLAESQHQMHNLRKYMMGAQYAMEVDREHLLKVYHEKAVMGELMRLLGDVESIYSHVDVQGKGVDVTDEKEMKRVVNGLLDAGNKLAREEMHGIKALRELIPKLRKRRNLILRYMIRAIEDKAFRGLFESLRPIDFGRVRAGRRRDLSSWGSGWVASNRSLSRTIRFQSIMKDDFSPLKEKKGSFGQLDGASGGEEGHVVGDGSLGGTLVSCVAQLGGTAEVLSSLTSHASQQFRVAMVQVIQQHAYYLRSPEKRSHIEMGQESPHLSQMQLRTAIKGVAMDRVGELVSAVFKRMEVIFRSLVACIKRLADARIRAPSAGVDMLRDEKSKDVESKVFGAVGDGAALDICKQVWKTLQTEATIFLACTLGMSFSDIEREQDFTSSSSYWLRSSIRSDGDFSGGLSQKYSQLQAREQRSGITFSIEEQNSILNNNSKKKESRSSVSISEIEGSVRQVLGGQCTLSSAPYVYGPTLRLVRSSQALIADLKEKECMKREENGKEGQGRGMRISQIFDHSTRWGSGGPGATNEEESSALYSYLVNVLRIEFLPSVYVECGKRIQILIEGADLLRPQRRHKIDADAAVVPVLPAAMEIVKMTENTLRWAQMVPILGPDFIGVLENALGKVIDSLQSRATSVSPSSQAIKLAHDPNIARMMAQEPIATLLGGPESFVLLEKSTVGSFISSAIASGFSAGEMLPDELVSRYLSLCPLSKDALILQETSDMRKIVTLACLGECAEFISRGISIAAQSVGFISEDSQSTSGGRRVYRGGRKVNLTESSSLQKDIVAGLGRISDRFKSVAGFCIRSLRLEAMLQLLYGLQSFKSMSGNSIEFEKALNAMSPKLASMDEVVTGYLPDNWRFFIFGTLPGFTMKLALQILPEISNINANHANQIARALAAVQPVLSRLGSFHNQNKDISSRLEQENMSGSKPLTKAIRYYQYIGLSFDETIEAARNDSEYQVFSKKEWETLLQVKQKTV